MMHCVEFSPNLGLKCRRLILGLRLVLGPLRGEAKDLVGLIFCLNHAFLNCLMLLCYLIKPEPPIKNSFQVS